MAAAFSLRPQTDSSIQKIEKSGKIPFLFDIKNGEIQPMPNNIIHSTEQKEPSKYLAVAGIVLERAQCSEWWGIGEYEGDYAERIFYGDVLGYLRVVYSRNAIDYIPLIYGVSAYNYELHCDIQAHEKSLNGFWGPYADPFKSDMSAKELLDRSLILTENPGCDKYRHFTLCLKLREDDYVTSVMLLNGAKNNHPRMGSFTFINDDSLVQGVKIVDAKYFIRKDYLDSCERLAREIYTFRDDIPETVEQLYYGDFGDLKVDFEGNSVAQIYANVFRKNLAILFKEKIDEEGVPHTSSPGAPNFGSYIGDGTYKAGDSYYGSHCWSRDIGRVAVEIMSHGMGKDRMLRFIDVIHDYLYDDKNKFFKAGWKRIANVKYLEGDWESLRQLKENDGHASMMLAVYTAYLRGYIDKTYIAAKYDCFKDAVAWIRWQVDNPELSNFCGVLSSESETSCQQHSLPDLYSNGIMVYALEGYARIFKFMGDAEMEKECLALKKILNDGANDYFVTTREKFGELYQDSTYDCWTYDYKRFVYAMIYSDICGYDLKEMDESIYKRILNSYREQKSRYFNPYSGRQMGYGQGYITETALMLDEVEDYTACVEACAYLCYHHKYFNYIVPEGVIMHHDGKYWFRNSDLGNAVQQAEIVKVGRLILGIDSLGEKVSFVPRKPKTFKRIAVEQYPVAYRKDGQLVSFQMNYSYEDIKEGYKFKLCTDTGAEIGSVRVGPFESSAVPIYKCTEKIKKFEQKIIANHSYFYFTFDKVVKDLELTVQGK